MFSFFSFTFYSLNEQHVKRPTFQNKLVGISWMALGARKGFEAWTDPCGTLILHVRTGKRKKQQQQQQHLHLALYIDNITYHMTHLRILLRIKGTWINFSRHGRTWQKPILENILNYIVRGAVASWLVRSFLERAVWVPTLGGNTVLCSRARHFTLTVPLSTQEY